MYIVCARSLYNDGIVLLATLTTRPRHGRTHLVHCSIEVMQARMGLIPGFGETRHFRKPERSQRRGEVTFRWRQIRFRDSIGDDNVLEIAG